MLSLRRPTPARIGDFLREQAALPHSYAEVGATREAPPPGYVVDRSRVRLGSGRQAFARAREALWRWEMFALPWVRLCWPHTPPRTGANVAVLARVAGLWLLSACRVVYEIDEGGPVERFGFAYGTLPAHAERGEERFLVEWCHADDSVWYELLAFSRPNHLLARLGYPFARLLQKRFAAGSRAAMARAVGGSA